jgi:hypothetical protein
LAAMIGSDLNSTSQRKGRRPHRQPWFSFWVRSQRRQTCDETRNGGADTV